MPHLSKQAVDAIQDVDSAKRLLHQVREELEALKAGESCQRVTINSIGDAVMTTDAKTRKNKRFLASIIEHSPLPTWIAGPDGYVIQTNTALCQTLNLSEDKIIGNYNALKDPNLVNANLMNKVHQVFFEKKIARFELLWRPSVFSENDYKDGKDRQINVILYPIIDESGDLKNVVCQWTDMTEVKETEFALEQSERLFRMSKDIAGVGAWWFDIRTKSIQWSPETYKIMGRKEQSYIPTNETLKELFYDNDQQIWEAALQDSIENSKPQSFEVRLVHPNGNIRRMHVSGQITHDSEGRPAILSGVIRDITDERKKEARLKMIYEATDNAYSGFNILDRNGKFVYVNKSYLKMWGYTSAEEVLGTDPTKHCVDPEKPRRIIETLKQAGRFEEVFEAQRKDGSHFTVLMNGGISYDEHGRELYFSSSLDITEREETHTKLLHLTNVLNSVREVNQLITRHQLDAATLIREATRILVRDREFSHVSCTLVDRSGNVTDHSESSDSSETCRLSETDQIGKPLPCQKLLNINDPFAHFYGNCDHNSCQKTCQELKPSHRFCGLLKYEQHIFGILTICTTKKTETSEEELTLFKEMCSDLAFALHNMRLETQKSEAFEQMAHAKLEAEIANRAKDEFLAVMSHELRTPLNPILGFTDLLKQDASAENCEILNIIQQSGERQLKLIEAILDYTRLDQGKLQKKHGSFNLLKICRLAFDEVRPLSTGLDYEFKNGDTNLEPIDEQLLVIHDSEVVIRILNNLLQNACKYTNTGYVRLTVGKLKSDTTDSAKFRFIIEDSGIGLSPTSIKQIFQAFTQVDSSCSRVNGGLGLGLSICKKLIELSDGKIEVSSEIGNGSQFTVTLPLSINTNKPIRPTQNSKSTFAPSTNAVQQLRVLLVEDAASNRLYFKALMDKLGVDHTLADGGYSAMEACQQQQFDVILMDLHMPEISGIETMELIRKTGMNQTTPVYALTADSSEAMRQECLSRGMVEVLTKPVVPDKMRSILERIAIA
jgi:PAS domain S-box-containing protein